MKPTLRVSDYISVLPMNVVPERGDVLVVEHPTRRESFVARLVGMPGERIQMIDGVLQINDVPVQVEPAGIFAEIMEPQGPLGLRPQCANGAVGSGAVCEKTRFIETLPNGASYEILDIGPRPTDDTGVFTVPEGHFFFIGDNRDNSNDSRNFIEAGGLGFVSEGAIVGRAARVVLPNWHEVPWWITVLTDDRFMERIN